MNEAPTPSTAPEEATPPAALRVAALGDLHVTADRTGDFRALFGEISRRADVMVLTGDLTNLGKVREAELLAEDLRACSIPVVGVLGNHDYESGAVEEVTAILKSTGMHLLNGTWVEIGGVGFVGVKGFPGGFGRRMLGSFGEPAMKAFVAESVREALLLENAMRHVSAERAVVVLHYSPILGTVVGEPEEIYPFLGSSRLAETIDRFKVKLVLHGHAHRGSYASETPGGIPVFNVAFHLVKPGGQPFALFEV
jgi:Icc-related predicted phosphoesterase